MLNTHIKDLLNTDHGSQDPVITVRHDEFETVKAMLKAHIDVLMQHQSYLRDIEAGKISDEELTAYLGEIFDFKIKDSQYFRMQYLPLLKDSVDIKFKVFLNLLKLMRHQDQEAALLGLYYVLETELHYESKNAQIAKKSNVDFSCKMETALNSFGLLKSMRKRLESILPESYAEMSKVIDFREHGTRRDKFTRGRPETFGSSHHYAWNRMMDGLKAKVEVMGKHEVQNAAAQKMEVRMQALDGWSDFLSSTLHTAGVASDAYDTSRIQAQFMLLSFVKFSLDGRIDHDNACGKDRESRNGGHVTEIYEHLCGNIQFYLETKRKLQPFESSVAQYEQYYLILNRLIKETRAGSELYEETKKRLQPQHRELCAQLEGCKASLMRFSGEQAAQEKIDLLLLRLESLSVMTNDCQECIARLGDRFHVSKTCQFIESIASEFQLAKKTILKELKKIKEEYSSIVETARAKKASQTPVDEPIVTAAVTKKDEARAQILREAERRNQLYREEVVAERLERQKKSAVAPRKEAIPEVGSSKLVLFKNTTLEDRLLNMSPKKFALLIALFELEPGIRYDKLCNLITKQLQGEIEEFGSSHKRIRIEKLYVEVTCNAPSVEDRKLTESESRPATGGTFRPHGTAHQAGIMGRFNMQLVVKALERAGITKAVLLTIQERRAANGIIVSDKIYQP